MLVSELREMTDLEYKKGAGLRTIRDLLIIGAGGFAYYLAYKYLHFGYFCWIYKFTGFKCGACGMTRMCASMIEFKFADAFWYNPFVFITLPYLIPEMIYIIYIMEAKKELPKWNVVIMIIYAVFFVSFGIVRNIIGI